MMPDRAAARAWLGIPDEASVAVYAGGLYPWKGVDIAARSWGRLPEDVWLVVAGGPPSDRERVLASIPESARGRVQFLPYLPREDVMRLYAAADVGLLCSSPEHDIGRVFTSPLKQFEYLAAGLPVLASDVPSSHEILTGDVARFYAPTEDGFAYSFCGMLADAEWRVRASKLGHAIIAPHTWEARAQKIENFLRSAGRGECVRILKES
jgi:glycosyltransferase involved in cell wall biosynthesis